MDFYDNSRYCQCIFFFLHCWGKSLIEAGWRTYFSSQWRAQSYMVGKAWRQEPEAAAHVASTVGKQKKQCQCSHPTTSFYPGPGPEPMAWCQPLLTLPTSSDLVLIDCENTSQTCPEVVAVVILNLVKLTTKSNHVRNLIHQAALTDAPKWMASGRPRTSGQRTGPSFTVTLYTLRGSSSSCDAAIFVTRSPYLPT